MPPILRLTEGRKRLLQIIALHRSLSSSQIYQEAHTDREYANVLRDLRKLREMRMIASHPIEPERGAAGEFAWTLLKAGAEAVGVTDYGTHYRRPPSREMVQQRSIELELARQVEIAHWSLIKPTPHSPKRPLPPETAQAQKLREAVGYVESRAIAEMRARNPYDAKLAERQRDYGQHMYRHSIPDKANDYVAYIAPPGRDVQAVALILCPPRATKEFWQARVQSYAALAARLTVIAVFAHVEQEGPYRDMIKAAGLKVTTVENISKALHAQHQKA